ncbi:hypothetical protein TNCV_3118271 [Trichonephila clavipes]|uniref:Uncharacterized protein n=1 Tax=Trichonephila clavipes TaxID=2585209 RepID=A0A8X6W951_TRICX|nr:hypothetical protein TNCV_3118271 [Trichonephila clavipes]
MSRKNLSIKEALAIFDDSTASKNSDDYVENFAQGENISNSDDEEIDEIQCASTSKPNVKWTKLYKKIDHLQNSLDLHLKF